MHPARPQQRAPGSFSSLPQQGNSSPAASSEQVAPRPRMRRVESSSSEDSILLNVANARSPTILQQQQHQQQQQQAGEGTPILPTPIYASFTSQPNSSSASLQNFSRPTQSLSTAAVRSVAASHEPPRNPSPLTSQFSTAASSTGGSSSRLHSRKHSQTAGAFEPTLPSITTSNLLHISMSHPSPQRELSASHIAAQAAVMNHQNQLHISQNMQQQPQQSHVRQRSQTVPPPGEPHELYPPTTKRGSGPLSPPMLSLTEASAPRESGFGSQGYHNGLLGSNAAATAANVAFPRSGQTSPVPPPHAPPPPPPPPLPEKKAEKSSKVKLFSRPGKISTRGESKDKPLPSPSKIGSAFSALQRGNFSTTSLDSTSQSFYNLGNSSAATIRPGDGTTEKEGKEKKHHFLSRQRHKPKDKEDYHLQLSSAASNSRPTDPSAPSSLYNFNLPSSPGTNSGTFKNISGLDLRHGGRALRQNRKEERIDPIDIASQSDWPGPSSLTSVSGPLYLEPIDSAKYGLHNMSLDDAWPYLRAKLLVIFEGGDLRLPVEDFNRVVIMHIQYCIHRKSPQIIVEDLRDMLTTGFSSLDHTLRKESEDRLIPSLVDLWILTFTTIMPYMQAVLLPLDLEFAGAGSLMTPDQAKDFWGGVANNSPADTPSTTWQGVNVKPASAVLDVRRLILTAYRDVVILPRYEKLKTIFSRLSLEFLPHSLASMALASPQPDSYLSTSPGADSSGSCSFQQRPGTAMSLDPATASYNSTAPTLLGDMASGNRSRGLSNVSFASSGNHSNGGDSSSGLRPPKLTAGSSSNISLAGSLRDQNVEDSKQVTDMVGRMLQCMSVLASIGVTGDRSAEGSKMVEELSRLLKLNWLGRGRTGRNRRGIVGGRVRRGVDQASIREEVSAI